MESHNQSGELNDWRAGAAMGQFWKWRWLSGVRGKYVDIDFHFLGLRGYLHIVYGDVPVCTKH